MCLLAVESLRGREYIKSMNVLQNKQRSKQTRGFTIVELLIVIVVIAILAAISIVAYNGIQKRARDAQRLSDITQIDKALKSYYAVNGTYPPQTASPGVGGFEASTDGDGTFLEHLKAAGFLVNPPKDPSNDSSYYYGYYLYSVGWGGNNCDNARGKYYVLYANRFESSPATAHPSSPGFSCSGRNWQGTANYQWVSGGFEN